MKIYTLFFGVPYDKYYYNGPQHPIVIIKAPTLPYRPPRKLQRPETPTRVNEGFYLRFCLELLGLPIAEKTYLSKDFYIEIIIRSPKKVGLFAYRLPLHNPYTL